MSESQFDLFAQLSAAPEPVPSAPAGPELLTLAQRLPAKLRLGTSSWAFPGWAGIVYAERATEQLLSLIHI